MQQAIPVARTSSLETTPRDLTEALDESLQAPEKFKTVESEEEEGHDEDREERKTISDAASLKGDPPTRMTTTMMMEQQVQAMAEALTETRIQEYI